MSKLQTQYTRSEFPGVDCGPTMTKQSFKDECDINLIMKRYSKSGVLNHLNKYEGRYGDFGDGLDFQSAMGHVIKAQDMFDELPAHVRKRFANSPAEFLDFVSDPVNSEEMVKLGLATLRPVQPPVSEAPRKGTFVSDDDASPRPARKDFKSRRATPDEDDDR